MTTNRCGISFTIVGMFIDNYGTGDANEVNITEEIHGGFNVTFVSAGGTFNTATNIITWEIQNIGSEDFKMLNYELVAPQTAGKYTINTTIEYTDENGTVYPVINISKSQKFMSIGVVRNCPQFFSGINRS